MGHGRFIVVGAVALSACSLLVETGDLAGVADPPDAAREVGTPDVSVDGTAPSDGSSSGTVPPDSGLDAAPRVCGATFCDDFDTPPLGAMWDSKTVSSSGSLTLGAGGLSPPNALVLDLTGTGNRRAFLQRSFAVIPVSIRCAVSINVEIAPTNGGADFEIISFIASGPGEPTVFLKVAGSRPLTLEYHSFTGLADGGEQEIFENVGTFALGAWTRIELKSDGLTSQVSLDSARHTYPVLNGGSLPVRVRLGESGDSDDPPVRARLDDFECTTE